MGNSEEGKACKSEKPSSLAQDQTNIHVYPDWSAMQAYYGPRVAVPPYFNPAVASGHAPHPYMWPPQAMMSPYGAPYAAIYAHGGVYAHPGVPIAAATSSSMETPAKSSGNTTQGSMKKLKGFDALVMSIGNSNADGAEDGADHGVSQSVETDGSSDGSDGNVGVASQNGKKRSREGTPTVDGVGKETQNSQFPAKKVNETSDKVMGVTVAPASVAVKVLGTVPSPNITTALELSNSPSANPKTSPTSVSPHCMVMPSEVWLQNEREMKRERRKQSNRESARRSRLRKQAETEELAMRVDSLIAENMTLKSEINRLMENSKKLKLENATLLEKLENARVGQTEKVTISKLDDRREPPLNTENLLARVHNSGAVDRNHENDESYKKKSNSDAKLHQLMDTSRRANAVAAG